MARRCEDALRCAEFGEPAEIKHRHPVADAFNHRKIVADEDIGEAECLFEVVENVQNLRLHRNVERGNRLIEHDKLGVGGQRTGDADALRLSAGELVRGSAPGIPARD